MPEVTGLEMPIVAARGDEKIGVLRLFTLPRLPGKLWDERSAIDRDQTLEPIQVAEGHEYRYEIELVAAASTAITTSRPELFLADSAAGLAGRLRPGLCTGLLPLTIFAEGSALGQCQLEVRSSKLDYLRDYRWMMRDIASSVAELAMDRFAATEQRFSPDANRDAATLYQQFAFLRHALTDEQFLAAIRHVLSRPHISWDEEPEARRPGQGWSGGSREMRQLAKPGRRVRVENTEGPLASHGVPALLTVQRPEPTLDNDANRFVRFALNRWLELTDLVSERLDKLTTPAGVRSRREALELRQLLQSFLAEGLLQDVGELSHFPSGNQVLQKREGYRDIYRLYALCEVASQLGWTGGEDVYGAGQRDVASLYEYWVFLQLAELVAGICGSSFDWTALFSTTADGMGLDLKRGRTARVGGTVERNGRQLKLDLHFNRTFSRRSGTESSWTRPLRPDCSLKVEWLDESAAKPEPVWVHFDAKYRVEALTELMTPAADEMDAIDAAEQNEVEEVQGRAKSDDILKMHAYRDAIRRSAGAYVVYPGTIPNLLREYHELLPGLGAFPLKPSEMGMAAGTSTVREFIVSVLDHLTTQVSQHERGRFWENRSYGSSLSVVNGKSSFAAFLSLPPADTRVVLGFVRDEAHFAWIGRERRYNLRADTRTGAVGLGSQALSASYVVLYSPRRESADVWSISGEPEVWTKAQMLRSGYSKPHGENYLCLPLGEELTGQLPMKITLDQILDVQRRLAPSASWGAPICVSWAELVERLS